MSSPVVRPGTLVSSVVGEVRFGYGIVSSPIETKSGVRYAIFWGRNGMSPPHHTLFALEDFIVAKKLRVEVY